MCDHAALGLATCPACGHAVEVVPASELRAEQMKSELLRRSLADADDRRCGGTKLLRPKEFKNPAPEYSVGIDCPGCKDCRC